MDITSFLYGMHYAGQLPSRAEYKNISRHLRYSGLVSGKVSEVEEEVKESIAQMHYNMFHEAEIAAQERIDQYLDGDREVNHGD
jgi:hypothetical protein